MKHTFSMLAALAFLGGCGHFGKPTDAASGGSSEQLAREFQRMDLDRDGYISRGEARNDLQVMRAFDWADADRDGRLNRSEFKQAPPTGFSAESN